MKEEVKDKKTKGVTTLKQLNKECLKIDLEKVELGKKQENWKPPKIFSTDAKGKNPHMKFGGDGTPDGICNQMFASHPSKKWEYEWSDKSPDQYWRELKILKFQGGKTGRSGFLHNEFSDAQILINTSTDEILGVLYALDNDYLNEWLRQTIDPSIRNNWDELQTEKEYEVLITTTTYSQEKVKVVGRSYEECIKKMEQDDPMLNVDCSYRPKTYLLFSGMKSTSNMQGEKPIPSSYEEWVSLQDSRGA